MSTTDLSKEEKDVKCMLHIKYVILIFTNLLDLQEKSCKKSMMMDDKIVTLINPQQSYQCSYNSLLIFKSLN
jgi:hypothetical protein